MRKFATVPLDDVPQRTGRGQHPFWYELMDALDRAFEKGHAVFVKDTQIPGSPKSADAAIRRVVQVSTQDYFRASIRAADGGRYVWLVYVNGEES